ncbi:hypothetical protein [Bradyrhizobium zhanjiangense]|nr:hypothetical protein [Bradyrhizobium zhanjiangense]
MAKHMIYRANDPLIDEHIRRSRQSIAEAIEVLETNAPPDTFLGRQHADLMPSQSQEVIE